ncbi:ester cyclase [Mariniflexile jejuense]|uniref:Ester cyclase n=1 Tax=Mariniflexile jejuense TaxID=1173582 RepID=A0ABW3JNX1_9FLAO
MKPSIILFLIATGFSFLSCDNAKTDKNIKMYTQVWDDIVNKGDIDKINTTNFDENITAISSPENIVGIENFKAYYQNFITGFSDIKFTVVDVFGEGDNIMKHWNFKGKHTGDFFGIPPTGKQVDIEGVTITKMKNGKIAQEQDFMDNTVFMQQLGIASSPENVSLINSLYNFFAVGDIPNVLANLDANVVWNEAEGNTYADKNPYIGPDAVLNGVFVRLGNDWNDFKLTDIKLHEMSNNQVLATLRYNGTYKKTNKPINAQVAHLWTLKDGKVTAFQQFVDTKQLANAEKK